jgi:RHH-type rel operon transcriptional repressor/antitoxin RelB
MEQQHTITFKAPLEIYARLEALSKQIDRPKSYLLRKAIEAFLEEQEDYLVALKRLADDKPQNRISLEEIERRYLPNEE